MIPRMRALGAAGTAAMLLPALAHAGAWTEREGGYYIKIALSRIDTRQEYNAFGRRAPLFSLYPGLREGEFSSTDIDLYAEYGVNGTFTLVGSTQVKSSNSVYVDTTGFVSRPNGGVGDIYLAGRLALMQSPFAGAVQFGWKIPSGDTGSAAAVALGGGTMDFDASVAVGGAIPIQGFNNYAQAQIGYTFRGGGFGDEIGYLLEFGFAVAGGALGAHAALDGSITQGPIVSPDAASSSAGFGVVNNQTFSRLTAGALIALSPKVQLTLDWATVLDGRNTLAGNTLTLGVALLRAWNTPLNAGK